MATEKDPPVPTAPAAAPLVALRESRERAISALSNAFAADELDIEEFERRLGIAHCTDSPGELVRLTADLLPPTAPVATTALAARPASALANPREHQRLTAILGGMSRGGSWAPARQVRVVALLGGVHLDFREAAMPPGVTEVHITAFMGGVHIIVPPQLAVEMQGVAILGGFEHSERAASLPDPERPILRVTGVAVFGGVQIETRLVGESERDAHRRRKSRRKSRREPAALPPRRNDHDDD